MSQQKPDEHVRIKIDLDELDETSAETKATYDKIRDWVGENYQLHVTNLNCDLCIKVTLNGIHYQGICLMA